MSPVIFMNNFERTYFGDSIFSSIGRALTISTRFENGCKMLAVILGLKERPLFENEKKFNGFIKELYRKQLVKDIEKILNSKNDDGHFLHIARQSRNEIVHEFTRGLDAPIDLLPKDEIKNLDSRLIELVENISLGDLFISLILSRLTKEAIPNSQFINNYRNRILEWVMDRTE